MASSSERKSLLVHIATGPENPSRVALALLVAATAVNDGHEVSVFVASDGVNLLREATIEAAQGIGTGSVAAHLKVLREAGSGLFASGQSANARGISPEALAALGFTAAPPAKLLELTFAADRVLTY